MLCRDIVYVDNVTMCLDEAVFYSLFNSPYTPHRIGFAIDVYLPDDEAICVFDEAKVLSIKRFSIPRNRTDGSNYDYVLLLELDSKHIAKILHVEPSRTLRINDKLVYGDYIGKTMISGYFFPWTEPHIHIEVRPRHNPYGVLHGYNIKLLRHREVPTAIDRVVGVITRIENGYILVKPRNTITYGLTPFAMRYNNYLAWLDGGYPQYRYIALLSTNSILQQKVVDVGLYRANIIENLEIDASIKNFKGISISIGRRELKILVNTIQGLNIGDEVDIELSRLKCNDVFHNA